MPTALNKVTHILLLSKEPLLPKVRGGFLLPGSWGLEAWNWELGGPEFWIAMVHFPAGWESGLPARSTWPSTG